jgi:DNA-3-methyladenine glycosylase
MKSLPPEFYARPVLAVAPDLLGCTVEHDGTAGVIVETEAYHDSEPACHAFVGLTPRTETLFGRPGVAYVYRSYGIHAMLNAVCEPEGVGAAVLIRALEPLSGLETMRARRSRDPLLPPRDRDLCSGPGKLTQALGISLGDNGSDLAGGTIRIAPRGEGWLDPPVVQSTRVGITRAVELPWRFSVLANPYVSRPLPGAQGARASGRRRAVAASPRS